MAPNFLLDTKVSTSDNHYIMPEVLQLPAFLHGRASVVGKTRSSANQPPIQNRTLAFRTAPFPYYGYRQLNPLTGRWVSRDRIGEDGGLNLYGFVGNDGVCVIDILGLAFFSNMDNITGISLNDRPKDGSWTPDQLGGTPPLPEIIPTGEDVVRKDCIKTVRDRNNQGRELTSTTYNVWIEKTEGRDVKIYAKYVNDQVGKLYTQPGMAAIEGHERRRLVAWKKSYDAYLAIFEPGRFPRCEQVNLGRQAADNYEAELKIWLSRTRTRALDEFKKWARKQQDFITKEHKSYKNENGVEWPGAGLFDSIGSIHPIPDPPPFSITCPPL
jgi:RHS repeat-associated protein